MDDKELRDLKRLVEENNRMLKKLQARARWSTFGTLLKWGIYITLMVLAWYYVQPFLEKALEAMNKVQEATDSVKGIEAKVDGIDKESILQMFNR